MSHRGVEKIADHNKYIFALCYLQCERMNDLLENRESQPEFGIMLNCFLSGSMPSNYLIEFNREVYSNMNDILKKHHII